MPYINFHDRAELADGTYDPGSPGELTYVLYRTCLRYVYPVSGNGLRFQDIAEVLGALEATKLEFQRRVAGPYEQQKLEENGDVLL